MEMSKKSRYQPTGQKPIPPIIFRYRKYLFI